jgi:hypothetical protein
MTRALTLLLFFATIKIYGQGGCETVPKAIIKKYEKYSVDQITKLKKSSDRETLFNIAEFLRHKGDTTYNFWYINFIDITRAEFVPGKNVTSSDCIVLFKVAKAYYYTGNFSHAQEALNDLKTSNCNESCIDYYLDQVSKIVPK